MFLDAVVNATRAAMATHQVEKLTALRNGVKNSIGENAPTLDEQARFFRLVDQFTASHLRLLSYLEDIGAFLDAKGFIPPTDPYGIIPHSGIEIALPEFQGREEWYELLASDLRQAFLIDSRSPVGMNLHSKDFRDLQIVTNLGMRFLRFIDLQQEDIKQEAG